MIDALNRDGFALVSGVLCPERIQSLITVLENADVTRSLRGGEVYGGRNLLGVPAIRHLAEDEKIRSLVRPILGQSACAVRGMFFDKTPGANWPVAWHQDLTVAVREKRDVPGWTKWTMKGGVVHAQPPMELLDRMLTLRVHLDDCSSDNGPLKVLPGTHLLGRLSSAQINILRDEIAGIICEASVGSVLMMRPLLVHASSPARAPCHRRVIHLEFAARDSLPSDLAWASAA